MINVNRIWTLTLKRSWTKTVIESNVRNTSQSSEIKSVKRVDSDPSRKKRRKDDKTSGEMTFVDKLKRKERRLLTSIEEISLTL